MRRILSNSLLAPLLLTAALLLALTLTAYAADAPKPKSADSKIALFDSYESLAQHFTKIYGNILYDSKTKAVIVNCENATDADGVIRYNAPWEELDLELAWEKLSIGNKKPVVVFNLGNADKSKNEAVDVSSAFAAAGKYQVKITYKNAVLSVFVNGVLAHKPIPIADPDVMNTLKFYLHASFAVVRITNPQVAGVPASPEKPVDADTPKPPAAPQFFNLFQTQDDFDKRWQDKKIAVYNADAKTITVSSDKGFPRYIGTFTYNKAWEELDVDVNADKNKFTIDRTPRFMITLNPNHLEDGEVFILDPSLSIFGHNQIKLVIEKGQTLSAYINGKLAHSPITLLRKTSVEQLRISIESGNPFIINAVRIKADPE